MTQWFALAALPSAMLLAACLPGDWGTPEGWASKAQIVEAAKRCGVSDFAPTEAGSAWAAYVPASVPDHAAREDCIYADLRGQGLKVTR